MSEFDKNSLNINKIPIIREAKVESIIDKTKSGTILTKIKGEKEALPATPLIPMYLSSLPKPGESVLLFQYDYKDTSPNSQFTSKRFWIGPVISQPTKLSNDPIESSINIFTDGPSKLKDPKIETGVIGNDDDVILQGRYNTDIIQKNKEMWFRVGKSLDGKPNKFNDINLGYIQLKYGGEELKRDVVEEEITEFRTESIDLSVVATFITYTNLDVALSNDLSDSNRYSEDDIDRTEVFVYVYNVKNNSQLITSLVDKTSFTGIDSRYRALETVKNYINTQTLSKKFRLKSEATDLIESYGGTDNIYTNAKTVPVTKKIKTVKISEDNTTETTSVINVVGSRINLISHEGPHTFNLTDPKSLISSEEQETINNEAHPIVYGDILVEFLELVKKYVSLHVHPYHGLPADPSTITTDVLRFDLNKILNENIRSN